MGVRYEGEGAEAVVVLMPFKPSKTLDNILATRCAVLNLTTDVRVFAGCVTGHRDWPMVALDGFAGHRLQNVLAWVELALTGDHPENPTLSLPCRDVFARGQRPVQVTGPVEAVADEKVATHRGFWDTRER